MVNEQRVQDIAALLVRGLSRLQKQNSDNDADKKLHGGSVAIVANTTEAPQPAGGER